MAYALLRYAAQYWHEHVGIASRYHDQSALTRSSLQLLNDEAGNSFFMNWLRICDPEKYKCGTDLGRESHQAAPPIYHASHRGLTQVTPQPLEAGASTDARSYTGATSLSAATYYGHMEVMQLLLEHGANPNAADNWGRTALHIIACQGNEKAMKMLLKYKSGVEAKNGPMRTADEFGEGSESNVEMQERHVSIMNGTQSSNLGAAAKSQEIVRLLITKQARLERRPLCSGATSRFHPPISDPVAILRILLNSGYSLELNSCTGWVPLHEAACDGHAIVIRLLLEAGAKSNVKTVYGWTPLHFAACDGIRATLHCMEWKKDGIRKRGAPSCYKCTAELC